MSFIHLVDTVAEIGEWTFSPLTLHDMGMFVLYFQYFPVFEAEFSTKHFSPELRSEILLKTHNECKERKLPITEINRETGEEKIVGYTKPVFEHPEVQEFASTLHGITYQVYLSLKHRHPNITLDKAVEILTPKMVKEVQTKLMTYMDEILEKFKEMEDVLPGELFPNLS